MADLSVSVNGIRFPNPVLPAAGPNVRNAGLMSRAAETGAGGIVSKTVSVSPAADPRPTMMKTVGGGLLNCETWSETGLEEFIGELRAVDRRGLPLVVSIGYRPEEVERLGKLIEQEVKPDAFEFSTHYTGSRTEPLVEVAAALKGAVSVPVWMKLSPAFPDIPALVEAAERYVDAFVAINSLGPGLDFSPEDPVPRLGSPSGEGWLSGPPILPIALSIVRRVASMTDRPVIGAGGIATGRDAVKFLMAGASLVQVCTAAIKGGPETYGRIAGEIDAWLDGNPRYACIADLVGAFGRNDGT